MSLFELIAPAALFGEVTKEAPPQAVREELAEAEPSPVQCALMAQASLLRAGFSEGVAFAGAHQVLADERPLIRNVGEDGKPTGRARKLSQKRSRALRALAAQIALEEQDDRSRPLA